MTTQHTNKATHMGHCQLCGHFQKLPKGVLSLHGYSKEWGFFSGTCSGSRALPYEVSTSELDAALVSANAAIERLGKQVDEALANETPNVYQRDLSMKGKPWVLRTLKLNGTRTNMHFKYGVMTDAALIGYFNVRYAQHLANRKAELQTYAVWLAERKANWAPAELKPVAA